jgi:hypothetical protein
MLSTGLHLASESTGDNRPATLTLTVSGAPVVPQRIPPAAAALLEGRASRKV